MISHSARLALAFATLSALLGVALIGLIGCGQASVPTPSCGTVALDHLGTVINSAEAMQDETCFSDGFQQCQAVSLGLSQMTSVDASVESIFSVQAASGGGCHVAEADYDFANTTQTATTTETCGGVSQQSEGLLITSCGASRRSVTIPAPPAATPTFPASPTISS
jgi:hypothetical protein